MPVTYHLSLIMPEDTYLEEDCDPFAELGGEEGVESLFDETIITRRQPPQRTLRPARHWGIPDFTDQCNGINSFVLRPEDCEDEGGVKIQLEHRRHSTGSDLWDAALVLAHALSRQHIIARTATRTDSLGSDSGNDDSHHQIIMLSDTLRNLNVLELGSGTGALGLYCAKCLGAKHVILTDLPDNLELLERNRQANNLQHKTSLLALNWEDQYLPALLTMNKEATFDILLGTDLLLPLLSTCWIL